MTSKITFTLTNENAITLISFSKLFKDLLMDLKTTFNDKVGSLIDNNKDYQHIINYCLPDYKDTMNADEYVSSIELTSISIDFMTALNNVYEYCKHTFAVRSIDILYQNEDIFLNKPNVKTSNASVICTMFLPDIEFSDLYYDDTSAQTKQTLWKYLQLILFNIITSIDDVSFFGDSLELLKIIDSNNFSAKIQSTVEELSNMFSFKAKSSTNEQEVEGEGEDEDQGEESFFDISGSPFGMFDTMFNDLSANFKGFADFAGINEDTDSDADADAGADADADADADANKAKHRDYAIPDKEELFSHLNNLINGKIGSLAKEIAEETSKDFDLESDNIGDVNELLKGFMKNPSKMMGLIENINKKINSKMKDGSIKESELLEEATEIFKNMKNMPGMNNFNDILKSMNLDKFMPKGGKINPNTFQNMMEQNVKMSKMKERMRKKAETNKEGFSASSVNATASANNATATANNATANKTDLKDITANLSSLMEEMKSNTNFIDDIIKKQGVSATNTPRSSDEQSKRSSNNKKKANRKNK
jgi:hypothetical protein